MIIHIIPYGPKEGMHKASESCHCSPLKETHFETGHPDGNLYQGSTFTHHAFDGREKYERQGIVGHKNGWILVEGQS